MPSLIMSERALVTTYRMRSMDSEYGLGQRLSKTTMHAFLAPDRAFRYSIVKTTPPPLVQEDMEVLERINLKMIDVI